MVSLAWMLLALLALAPVTVLLQGAFPIFTVVWLVVPLVVLLRTRDATKIGVRTVPWRAFARVTAINLGGLLLVAVFVEPWSHAYQRLVVLAMGTVPADTTFAWLTRFEGLTAWGSFLAYTGLVTIFAEELFFRGWLLQLLLRHMRPRFAVILQAALFALPQSIAALFMSPLQGIVYTVIYAWFAIGVIGGWAAVRTRSILPSQVAATAFNLILTALAVS